MEKNNVSREKMVIRLLMPVSVLDFGLNMWKEPVEANKLSNKGARNWLLTCHLGLAKVITI